MHAYEGMESTSSLCVPRPRDGFFLGWAPVLQVDAVPHTVANRLATLTESTPHCGGLIPPLC
jgi:hypothetical protein